jgi:hypothetical protein
MTWFGSGGNSVLAYTTNNQYSPGETIQGHVLVSIVSATSYSGLFVKLAAKERVRFEEQEPYIVAVTETESVDGRTETRTVTKTKYRTVMRFATHILFKIEIMMLNGGDLVPGQFTVPFSFVLPGGLLDLLNLMGSTTSPELTTRFRHCRECKEYSNRIFGLSVCLR